MKTGFPAYIFRIICVAMLNAAFLINPVIVQATPPIGGETLGFGSEQNVGATDNTVKAIALGDLDNDGDLDIVTGSQDVTGNEILGWENIGTGWVKRDIGALSGTFSVNTIALGDLDNDGDLDIVSGASSGTTKVWQNDGNPWDGAWIPNDVYTQVAAEAHSIAIGDLNKDGYLDIVTGHTDGTITAFRNEKDPWGVGDWGLSGVNGLGVDINSLSLGDLDKDGDLDIVVGLDHETSGMYYQIKGLKNNGAPFDDTWVDYSIGQVAVGHDVNSIALGDMDEDGNLDIVSGATSGTIKVWQNNGAPWDGVWTHRDVGTSADVINALVLGDLDGDGDLDITSGSSAGENYEVITWMNDGTPFIDAWMQTDVGACDTYVYAIALGDLDKDGDLDIVTGSGAAEDFEVAVWMNVLPHRNLPFSTKKPVGSVEDDIVLDVAAGDIDQDGDLDLVTGQWIGYNITGEILVWENDASPWDGVWTSQVVGTLSAPVKSVALGDLDNDSDLDIVAGTYSSTGYEVVAFQNNGASPWTPRNVADIDATVNSVALTDLDRDGALEIVAGTDAITTTNEIRAWDNDGAWIWTPHVVGDPKYNVLSLASGDLDRDGCPDIVSTTSYSSIRDEVIAWRGDCSWGWTQRDIGDSSDYVRTVALSDLDNDGDLDIITGSDTLEDYELIAWQNSGDPWATTWSPNNIGAVSPGVSDLVAVDLDQDGDYDVASLPDTSGSPLIIWTNDGTPFSDLWTGTTVGNLDAIGLGITTGDLDKDGDPDLAAVLNASPTYEVIAWQNQGGSAALSPQVSAPSGIPPNIEKALLKVPFDHRGIASDLDLELNRFDIHLLASDCATPLTTAQAEALLSHLIVRLDDGDDMFEISDQAVADVMVFSLADGVQSIYFANGDANVLLAQDSSKTLWISIVAETIGNLCLVFDPDADAIVEAKHTTPSPPATDFSVSIQDTQKTSTGEVTIAYLIFTPVIMR